MRRRPKQRIFNSIILKSSYSGGIGEHMYTKSLACVSLTTVAASISSCTAAPAAVIASLATSSADAAADDSIAAFSSVHRTCAGLHGCLCAAP